MSESVAVVSAVDPYPIDAGKKVVLAGFVEYFIDRFGPHNVHYLLVGGSDGKGFPAHLHPLPAPRTAAALGNLAVRTLTGRASMQESLLRSAEVSRAINTALESLSPSMEVYDTIRMSQYAPEPAGQRQICYLDDLFSERYQSMLEVARRHPDVQLSPLGNFSTHVPQRLRPLADHSRGQRVLLSMERKLVSRAEDRAVARFPTVVLLNDGEAQTLRSRTGGQPGGVATVPPLVTSATGLRDYGGAADFVFLGQLSLPHNEDGLRSFLTTVWPLVLGARPDARLHVVGRSPREGLVELISRFPDSVVLEGYVPDLRGLLGRSAAMVNPLRFGSGVKLKVIEALGAGLPVVSTTVGVDGLDHGADDGIVVADDPAEMAELLLSTTSPRINRALSAASHEHFARRYCRAAVFARYDEVFGTVGGARRNQRGRSAAHGALPAPESLVETMRC